MPPVDPHTLAADVRALLDQPVAEGECWKDQPVCQPDQRVTAQLIRRDPEEQILPWRIVNADKGDLLLTPGGPAGFIGAMLGQLDPAEFFSHMGIVVRAQTQLRHCTTSPDWLRKYPHKADNLPADATRPFVPDSLNDAPTDGFEENRLRYLWPGTITQTVEAAYLSFRNWGTDAEPHLVLDTELNESFRVAALTFKPEPFPNPDGSSQLVWPVLVKRCANPAFTKQDNDVLHDAVDRVVAAAEDLRGHYRFYTYTRAAVGLEQQGLGPAMFEAQEPAPLGPGCVGRMGRATRPTQQTVGAQCASLVWLAVQRANQAAAAIGQTQIVLDATSVDPEHAFECSEESYLRPRRVGADRIFSGGVGQGRTADGLYFYPPNERLRAGEELYSKLHDDVQGEVVSSVQLQHSFDEATAGGVGKPLWVVLNLLSAGVPLAMIPAMLGITDAVLRELIVLFSDMPDDVATQVANAFASDDCSVDAKDSTAWKDDPGTGETVSPDAILRYWSPPVMANRERVVGLWGRNVMANPPLPPVRKKLGPPPSTWQISTGPWTLTESQLVREHGGVVTPVVGGTLRIGCDRLVSGDAGLLPTTQLPAGRYWAEAWWDEPVTGIRWSTPGEVVEAQEGETHAFTFRLQPPPDNLRCVLVHVHMDNVNRKAVGKDWWDHPEWTLPYAHLGEDFADPVVQIPQPGQDNPFRDGRDIDDWGRSEFELSFTLVTQAPAGPADPPQWSVRIGWKIRINQHDQDDPWTDKGEVIAPPKASPLDPGVILEDDLQRLDLWPVRSHIRIEVHNNRA